MELGIIKMNKIIFAVGLYQVCKSLGTSCLDLLHQTYHYEHLPAYHRLAAHYAKNSQDLDHQPWAAITGGSDGIGRALAMNLAKRGFNVALIGRDQDKMDQTAKDLKRITNNSISVQTINIDFSCAYPSCYGSLYDQLSQLPRLGLLVSNAGASPYPLYSHFFQQSPSSIQDQVRVNVLPQLLLYKYLLQRGTPEAYAQPTTFVQVSSINMIKPAQATMASYGASKAFNYRFANVTVPRGPAGPAGRKEVDSLVVMPGLVSTKFVNYMPVSWMCVGPESEAEAIVRALVGKARCTYGYPTHTVLAGLFRLVPNEMAQKARLSQGK